MARIPGFPRGREIRLHLDGRTVPARDGETVGAALHAAGHVTLGRSLKYHRPRGQFCMVGKCASCMMTVDGVPNTRVCTLPARDGMRVEAQNALPSARLDLLSASDRLFRRSFDYHDKFIRPRFLTPLYHWVIRRMAGYGALPANPPPAPRPPIRALETDVLVAGGGAAGLGAALAAAQAGRRVLLLEESAVLGGDLALSEPARAEGLGRAAREAGAQLRNGVPVVGVYPEDRAVVAMAPEGLLQIRARSLVVATGAQENPPLFPSNDLPGILGARAALILLRRHGVPPGRRPVLLGESPLADAVEGALGAAGRRLRRVPAGATVLRALGRTRLTGLLLERHGREERWACDALLVAQGESPRPEILQQAGARLVWDEAGGGLVPQVDAQGATTAPGVFAAGSAARLMDPDSALEHGRGVGRAAARAVTV